MPFFHTNFIKHFHQRAILAMKLIATAPSLTIPPFHELAFTTASLNVILLAFNIESDWRYVVPFMLCYFVFLQ